MKDAKKEDRKERETKRRRKTSVNFF